MIIFLFVRLFIFIFKWQRLIFVLISLEFLMLSLFLKFSSFLTEMMFFYFICFSVVSRILGIIVMVGNMKFYGNDYCIFYRCKLSLNYWSSKSKIYFCI